jgi:hypothetical protein
MPSAEAPGAARLPVALTGGVDQRQAARMAGLEEAILDRRAEALGMAGAGEARGGHGPAVPDEARGLFRGNHFHRFAADSTVSV